ncbi:MAG: hypothetical protein IJ356_06190 [Erysipelotrichaceae bacterium]|nr:hypothetical protein [Erysipelotrichaceae bacterium]
MFKKVSIVFFSVLWLCSVCLFVYRLTEPKTATDPSTQVVNTFNDGPIESTPSQTEDSSNTIKYYYFCTADHQDCAYMNDTILKSLAVEMNVENFEFLEFVDAEKLYGDWTPSKLKSTWGFERYPALVAAKDLGNSFEILNVLEWTEELPLDTNSVKEWMIQNELWTGAIEDAGELIDKPLDEQ